MPEQPITERDHRLRAFDLHRAVPEATISRAGFLSVDDKQLLIALRQRWDAILAAAAASGYVSDEEFAQHKAESHTALPDVTTLPGQLDHGGLAGLADDDHPQYLTAAEGDAAYAPIAEGVTNGNSHDHSGGDGAAISFNNLADLPAGYTGTVALAPLTGGGTPGSLTVDRGVITAYTPPT